VKIRAARRVDRRRHSYDIDPAVLQVSQDAGELDVPRRLQLRGINFQRVVDAILERTHPRLVDVVADYIQLLRERKGQRKADIAQPDDADICWFKFHVTRSVYQRFYAQNALAICMIRFRFVTYVIWSASTIYRCRASAPSSDTRAAP